MHAAIQATLYNAHFDSKGVPWTPADMLGKGDRDKRKAGLLKDRLATLKMSNLVKPTKTEDTGELPDWASRANATRVN